MAQPAQMAELKLEALSAQSVLTSGAVCMRYRLTNGVSGIEGAKLIARFEVAGVPLAYSRTVTDTDGEADVHFSLPASIKPADVLSITVQASRDGRSTARRFRMNRA